MVCLNIITAHRLEKQPLEVVLIRTYIYTRQVKGLFCSGQDQLLKESGQYVFAKELYASSSRALKRVLMEGFYSNYYFYRFIP